MIPSGSRGRRSLRVRLLLRRGGGPFPFGFPERRRRERLLGVCVCGILFPPRFPRAVPQLLGMARFGSASGLLAGVCLVAVCAGESQIQFQTAGRVAAFLPSPLLAVYQRTAPRTFPFPLVPFPIFFLFLCVRAYTYSLLTIK